MSLSHPKDPTPFKKSRESIGALFLFPMAGKSQNRPFGKNIKIEPLTLRSKPPSHSVDNKQPAWGHSKEIQGTRVQKKPINHTESQRSEEPF